MVTGTYVAIFQSRSMTQKETTTYSEQQNHSSVGHFHKDCFVVLETPGLNLWNLEDMYFDILSSNLKKIMWSEQELSRQEPIQNGSTLE